MFKLEVEYNCLARTSLTPAGTQLAEQRATAIKNVTASYLNKETSNNEEDASEGYDLEETIFASRFHFSKKFEGQVLNSIQHTLNTDAVKQQRWSRFGYTMITEENHCTEIELSNVQEFQVWYNDLEKRISARMEKWATWPIKNAPITRFLERNGGVATINRQGSVDYMDHAVDARWKQAAEICGWSGNEPLKYSQRQRKFEKMSPQALESKILNDVRTLAENIDLGLSQQLEVPLLVKLSGEFTRFLEKKTYTVPISDTYPKDGLYKLIPDTYRKRVLAFFMDNGESTESPFEYSDKEFHQLHKVDFTRRTGVLSLAWSAARRPSFLTPNFTLLAHLEDKGRHNYVLLKGKSYVTTWHQDLQRPPHTAFLTQVSGKTVLWGVPVALWGVIHEYLPLASFEILRKELERRKWFFKVTLLAGDTVVVWPHCVHLAYVPDDSTDLSVIRASEIELKNARARLMENDIHLDSDKEIKVLTPKKKKEGKRKYIDLTEPNVDEELLSIKNPRVLDPVEVQRQREARDQRQKERDLADPLVKGKADSLYIKRLQDTEDFVAETANLNKREAKTKIQRTSKEAEEEKPDQEMDQALEESEESEVAAEESADKPVDTSLPTKADQVREELEAKEKEDIARETQKSPEEEADETQEDKTAEEGTAEHGRVIAEMDTRKDKNKAE